MSQINITGATDNAGLNKWTVWYQPGSKDDSQVYSKALEKCKRVNQDINPEPFTLDRHGRIASKIIESTPIRVQRQRLFHASWVTDLVEKERKRIEAKQASGSEWAQTMSNVAYKIIGIATELKPVIDIFVPSSPEYSVPYACLWIIFKGFVARKEKKDSVMELVISLSEDINVFEAFKDMFPTDDMKITLSEFYVHTVDLLWRLAEYYSHRFFRQMTDALFSSEKYNFSVYRNNIKKAATRLKLLCDTGHVAEQKYIKDRVDGLDYEVRRLAQQLENMRLAQARQYASGIIDIWDNEVGDVEQELQLWESLQFYTDMRDHWSQNGTLRCLTEWRRSCDKSENSILWISTESNGRQSWVTEFSVDLIRVFRSQGKRTVFAFCDRPKGVRWTPQQLLKQLIAQLMNQDPELVISGPGVFNKREFRKSATFNSTFRLLHSVVAMLESLVIVIDRLDLRILDPNEPKHSNQGIAQALSILVRAYPRTLRVIITTGQIATPQSSPRLPISFAMVSTRRPPRRRYEDETVDTMVSTIGNEMYEITEVMSTRDASPSSTDVVPESSRRRLIPHC